MPGQKILIIEDESNIRELMRYNLEREGYTVKEADNGEDGLLAVGVEKPDLILLDLMLPGISGLDICQRLRSKPEYLKLPIIMVTAKGEEDDIVAGLELGADDYVVKPFSLKVLLARVGRALARPVGHHEEKVSSIEIAGLKIDVQKHEVSNNGALVDLTSSEFSLLQFLAEHPGWVYTRGQIVRAVHGDDYPVTDRSVDVMVLGLRRKLGPAGQLIETVRGVGYRFTE